jgi:hypothetical protein
MRRRGLGMHTTALSPAPAASAASGQLVEPLSAAGALPRPRPALLAEQPHGALVRSRHIVFVHGLISTHLRACVHVCRSPCRAPSTHRSVSLIGASSTTAQHILN